MTCFNPLRAYRTAGGIVFSEKRSHGDFLGALDLPCGQCTGCRARRASDWEMRVMHEASCWASNCFVTLTYAPGNLPPHGSLDHRDFQLFMKRLRKARSYRCPETGKLIVVRIRFYMCGEYGEARLRPHYHACLFNVDFPDRVPCGKSDSGFQLFESAELTRLWGLGRAVVQDLVPATAAYCARYVMKKVLGKDSEYAYSSLCPDTGELVSRRPEYAAMSLKPGIGFDWVSKFGRVLHAADYIVSDGVKRRFPKYYDSKLKDMQPEVAEAVAYARELRGRAAFADNTPERLAVREEVQKARLRSFKRTLK